MTSINDNISQQLAQGYYRPLNGAHQDDEISLLEIWTALSKNKYLIALITAICFGLALALAFWMTPVYKATAHLLPPSEMDTQELRQQDFKGVDSLYSDFKQNAKSRSFKKDFFEQAQLASFLQGNTEIKQPNINDAFMTFDKLLTIGLDRKDPTLMTVSLQWKNPEQAAAIVNDYVAYVNQETVRRAVENFEEYMQVMQSDLKYTIAAKRGAAHKQLENKIAILKEALAIAKSLEIIEPPNAQTIQQQTALQHLKLMDSTSPLYYRGAKALAAEIRVLSERTHHDAFIPGLTELEESINHLSLVEVNQSKLKAATLDLQAIPPKGMDKPKRPLIVVLGVLLGLMLGCFVALLKSFIANQREKGLSSAS